MSDVVVIGITPDGWPIWDVDPESKGNEAQLRTLLHKWVEKDEARHPDFQDKELIQESKELINKSRQ